MPAKIDFYVSTLIEAIEDEVATEPFPFLGQTWALLGDGQAKLAEDLGVELKTLQRRLKLPPFKTRAKVDAEGKRCTLLRIRKPGEPAFTSEELKHDKASADSKAMKAVWKAKFDKSPTGLNAQYLYGFADALAAFPDVDRVEVFKYALKEWQFVMTAIKQAALANPKPGWNVRYYDFPNIFYIRHFWKAVLHAYVMKLQEEGTILNGKLSATAAILQATEFDLIPDDVPYPDPDDVAELMTEKAEKISAKKAKKLV